MAKASSSQAAIETGGWLGFTIQTLTCIWVGDLQSLGQPHFPQFFDKRLPF